MHKPKEQADQNLLRESQRESWRAPSPPPDFADRVLAALSAPQAKAPPATTAAKRRSGPALLAASGALALAASFALGVVVSPRLLSPRGEEGEVEPLITAVSPSPQIDPTQDKGEPEMLMKGTATLALGSVLAAVSPFFLKGEGAAPTSSGPDKTEQFCGEVITACHEAEGQDVLLCRKVTVFCEEAGVPLSAGDGCEEEAPHPHKHEHEHKTSELAPEPFRVDDEDWQEDWEEMEELAEEMEELAEEIEKLNTKEAKMRFEVAAEGIGDGVFHWDHDPKLQKAKKKLQKKLQERQKKLQKLQKKLQEAQRHQESFGLGEGIAPPAPYGDMVDPFAPAPPAPPAPPSATFDPFAPAPPAPPAPYGDMVDPFAPAPPAPPALPDIEISLDDVAPGLTIKIEGLQGLPDVVIEEILKEIEVELGGERGESEKYKRKVRKKLRKKIEKERNKHDDDDEDDDDDD